MMYYKAQSSAVVSRSQSPVMNRTVKQHKSSLLIPSFLVFFVYFAITALYYSKESCQKLESFATNKNFNIVYKYLAEGKDKFNKFFTELKLKWINFDHLLISIIATEMYRTLGLCSTIFPVNCVIPALFITNKDAYKLISSEQSCWIALLISIIIARNSIKIGEKCGIAQSLLTIYSSVLLAFSTLFMADSFFPSAVILVIQAFRGYKNKFAMAVVLSVSAAIFGALIVIFEDESLKEYIAFGYDNAQIASGLKNSPVALIVILLGLVCFIGNYEKCYNADVLLFAGIGCIFNFINNKSDAMAIFNTTLLLVYLIPFAASGISNLPFYKFLCIGSAVYLLLFIIAIVKKNNAQI